MSTPESSARAKDAFEQAIELDPEYPEAYAELANWHFLQAAVGLRPVGGDKRPLIATRV